MAQGRLGVPLDCSPRPPEKPPMEALCICCSTRHRGRGAEAKVLIEYPGISLETDSSSH